MREAERARVDAPAPGRALALALMALAGAWLLSIAAAASTPLDALAYQDPAVADARDELALARRAVAGVPGLAVSLTASPSLGYGTLATGEVVSGDVADFGGPPAWSADLLLGATVTYGYDRVALLDGRAALLRARADVAAAARRGVYKALDVHAQLLQAQLATRQDAAQLEAARQSSATQTAAERDLARQDTAQARLLLATLRLQRDEDVARLADLRRRAGAYGLEPEAAYAPLRFVLPEPALERTSRYRLAVLARERAQAQRDQDLIYGTVQGLALSAGGVSGGVGLVMHAGIVGARPGAELGLSYPAGADGWSVGVSATFVLSSDLGRLAQDDAAVRRARARVEALVRDFPQRAARLRSEAAFAERELALAERRAAAENAGGALVQAWARYLRSVYAYLDYVEAPWQARDAHTP